MEPENKQRYESLQDQLNTQQEALVKIYKSVEKTRKYIFWTGVFNLVMLVLPLIAVAIMLPKLMNTIQSSFGTVLGDNAVVEVNGQQRSLSESLELLEGLGVKL